MQQPDSIFLPLYVIIHTAKRARNIRDLLELIPFKVQMEDNEGLSRPIKCFRCQNIGHEDKFCNLTPKYVKCGESHLSSERHKSKQGPPN
jgi:hypothetical protein